MAAGVEKATEVATIKWKREREMLKPVAIRREKGIIKYVINTTKIVESIYRKKRNIQ